MTYTTTNDKAVTLEAATIEAALNNAASMIYMGDKTRQAAAATLEQGKPFTVVYGFKEVHITAKA